MEKSEKIKQTLYQFLNNVSEKKIQTLLLEGKSSEIMSQILRNCIQKIKLLDNNQDENLGILAESISHYLLTNAMIPSQRKIETNGVKINLVIPDMKTLRSSPKNALVILFPKSCDKQIIKNEVEEIKKIQPNNENIWLVLKKDLKTEYRTFEIEGKHGSFVRIIDEILDFLSSKKQTKLRIFKS